MCVFQIPIDQTIEWHFDESVTFQEQIFSNVLQMMIVGIFNTKFEISVTCVFMMLSQADKRLIGCCNGFVFSSEFFFQSV